MLIDHWLLKAEVSIIADHDQVSIAVNSAASRALKSHLNSIWVGSRGQLKIELQAPFVAVVNQAGAGVNTCSTIDREVLERAAQVYALPRIEIKGSEAG